MATEITKQPADVLDLAGFRTLSAEQLNTPVTWDDVANVAPDDVFVGSPYTVLTGREKDKLIDTPFLIRSVRFSQDKETENPFVILHLVTKDNEMYIITDGSTGIYQQVGALVASRIAQGHATPAESIMVPNGLRVSEYGVTAEGKPAKPGEKIVSQGATYYLA